MDDWSDLADEAQALGQGPRCQVEILLNHLSDSDAEKVRTALANKDLTNPGLRRAIERRLGDSSPYAPSKWSIGNHRRKDCRCWR